MPTPLLNAFAERLPHISAQESLVAAERAAVGNITLRRHDRRRIMGGWERLSNQHRAPVIRPKSPEMYRAQMAGLGIGVKRVPVKRDG